MEKQIEIAAGENLDEETEKKAEEVTEKVEEGIE